ncbi:DEAD/DEAH box helicase [Microbacterium mitrae]|uniref:DEAD/DEAH box helicase n=1 Tax=Microbacterium mitrae TaxID=664640 RepID=A0A5C8HMG1_9MICO|nr:DEAD/DEAH box helicase [Microbacterium mitrae]
MARDFDWSSDFALDLEYGFANRAVAAPKANGPRLVDNADDNTMLRALREELKTSSQFVFSVAFVSPGAISLLKQELVSFRGAGTIITSDYLGFNSPGAFRELLALRNHGIDVRLHSAAAFHPKGYIFEHDSRVTMILGSSNLTKSALVTNHEWNLRVSALEGSDLGDQIDHLVDGQLSNSIELTEQWVDEYELTYVAPPRNSRTRTIVGSGDTRMPDPDRPLPLIAPNAMQAEALSELDAIRRSGKDKAIVISATGTGKTILSAFDVRAVDPDRFLFVVHREQILDKAIQEFQRVLGAAPSDFGKISGSERATDARYVFATRQSLSRDDVLQSIDPHAFEYILIDEAHGAASESYRKILSHFRPTFLLGMTATPERTDGADLFELFDYNVAYEIRLNRALEENMLVPFHYFGVTDYTTDDGSTIGDNFADLPKLLSHARVDHIRATLETYGHKSTPVKGLIFCRSKAEAHGLAEALNRSSVDGKPLRTRALTGDDTIEQREAAVALLEGGELDYILTVDVFNEGIDIPSVNQVVMLRQTQSAIIFVQQLGRGLRIAPDKEFLVVIDFIGNYANNYLIPVALFGDESLNRESVRKNLIAAEEIGVVSGLSSVRFDEIAQQRVLEAIAAAKLDSMANLRAALENMQARLGRVPLLADFQRFDAADPVVLGTVRGNYPELVSKLLKVPTGLSTEEWDALALLSQEVLAAKRPHEAIVVRELLAHGERSVDQLIDAIVSQGFSATPAQVDTAVRALTFEFYTEQERNKYKIPLAERRDGIIAATGVFGRNASRSESFVSAIEDLLETTIAVVSERYFSDVPFVQGRQYSRKDACRLLSWSKNVSATIYGYKVDALTRTCPIFVTLHKSDEISASTAYGDELLSRSTMRWFTRSRRTLQSGEVRSIVENEVDLHVFVKKDDAEGSDFYYLGKARSEGAAETVMPGDTPHAVVEMILRFDQSIDAALFDYFQPMLTSAS